MTAKGSYGTKNQGWKDSGDAIVYDDGTPVPSPIGTSELPASWFAAQLMAFLSGAMSGWSSGVIQTSSCQLRARGCAVCETSGVHPHGPAGADGRCRGVVGTAVCGK